MQVFFVKGYSLRDMLYCRAVAWHKKVVKKSFLKKYCLFRRNFGGQHQFAREDLYWVLESRKKATAVNKLGD